MNHVCSLFNSATGRIFGCLSAIVSMILTVLSLGLLLWQVWVQTRAFQKDPLPEQPKIERPAKRR